MRIPWKKIGEFIVKKGGKLALDAILTKIGAKKTQSDAKK